MSAWQLCLARGHAAKVTDAQLAILFAVVIFGPMDQTNERADFEARIAGFTGQIAHLAHATTGKTGLAPFIVAQLFEDAIRASTEYAALATQLANYRANRMHEAKPGSKPSSKVVPVSRDRAAGARRDAIRLLNVGLFPDAREEDIRFAEQVRDLALSQTGLLQKVIQQKGARPEDERYVWEEEPPLPRAEPWQIALAKIFEGHGLIPFRQPFRAVKTILEELVRVCGEAPPTRFMTALEAMQGVEAETEIPVGHDRDRIKAAMAFIDSLYDDASGEVFIRFDGAGGNREHTIYMPWGAASRLSDKFGVPMPERPRRK